MESQPLQNLTEDQAEALNDGRITSNAEAIALLEALEAWRCPACRGNNPRVVKTVEQVRYVSCRHCHYKGPGAKVYVEAPDPVEPDLEPDPEPKTKTKTKRKG